MHGEQEGLGGECEFASSISKRFLAQFEVSNKELLCLYLYD